MVEVYSGEYLYIYVIWFKGGQNNFIIIRRKHNIWHTDGNNQR
jgi:hypothetical protein